MLRATPSNIALPAPGCRQGGFTLTELVLVIVMIGILAVVVVPSFNAQPFLARGFHDEVASAARHAQKLAVASGCPVQLSISGTPLKYQLHQQSGCPGGGFDTLVAHPARAGGFESEAPSGVALSGGPIVFNPNGSSSGGSLMVGSRSIAVLATGHVQAD